MPVSCLTESRWIYRRGWGRESCAGSLVTAAESKHGWFWRIQLGPEAVHGWGACGRDAQYGQGSQNLPTADWGSQGLLEWAGCHAESVLSRSAAPAQPAIPKAQGDVYWWKRDEPGHPSSSKTKRINIPCNSAPDFLLQNWDTVKNVKGSNTKILF